MRGGGAVTTYSVRFEFDLKMTRAWHIGTGLARGLIDRTINRDARGSVYVPASTIKGRLRNACEHVARMYNSKSNQLQVCNPPDPRFMCRGSAACITCRIFGSAYAGEQLYFEDGCLQQEQAIYDLSNQAQPRARVKLDRKRGIAASGHLFTSEYAELGLTFRSRAVGRLPLTPIDEDITQSYELILLAAGMRMLKELGGDKSVGFGACETSFVGCLHVNGKTISPGTLFEMIDLLEFYGS